MKNTLYLLLLCAVVSFVGCQKDVEVQPEETEIERSSDRRKKKVKVCHCSYGANGPEWKVKKVNKNALRAHLRHGDFKMKDKDGDGFYQENPCVPADEVDCDDWNRFVNPACAEDPTNGIDDNCDGEIDEGGAVDADDDGFNDDVDCDDNDANVNPGATEVPYNGIDEDCDPATLDDDLDGDGFNADADCDDNDPEVNVTCVSCPLVEALDLENVTFIEPSFRELFSGGAGYLYTLVTASVDNSGNEVTEVLGIVIVENFYAYIGSYYKDDGTLVYISPLILSGPNPELVQGQFANLEEADKCTAFLVDALDAIVTQ